MKRSNQLTHLPATNPIIGLMASVLLAACGGESAEESHSAEPVDVAASAPSVAFKPSNDKFDGTIAKPGSPYSISYRIIGTPIVGSPVVVALRVSSSLDPQPLNLAYRINDASSLLLAESQPDSMRMEFADNEGSIDQQVTVIPQREGRLYLNVSAAFETDRGTMSTVAAIPIQVGTGSRELEAHGEVELDENGEAVRVLKAD